MNQSNEHFKRAQRHWYEDGLTEMGIGIACILYSFYFLLIPYLPHNLSEATVVIVIAVLMFILIVIFRTVILRIKANVSYPRTGYVKVRKPKSTMPLYKRVLLVIGSFILSLLSIYPMLYIMTLREQMTYFIFSLFIAVGVIYSGMRLNIPRFILLGILIICLGGVLAFSDLHGMVGLTILYIGSGILAILSGLIAFVRYVRTYQPIDMETT